MATIDLGKLNLIGENNMMLQPAMCQMTAYIMQMECYVQLYL